VRGEPFVERGEVCPARRKPRIRIYAEPEGSTMRLIVEDNGEGIASEDIVRIFGLFERVHPASSYEGTGDVLPSCARRWSAWEARWA